MDDVRSPSSDDSDSGSEGSDLLPDESIDFRVGGGGAPSHTGPAATLPEKKKDSPAAAPTALSSKGSQQQQQQQHRPRGQSVWAVGHAPSSSSGAVASGKPLSSGLGGSQAVASSAAKKNKDAHQFEQALQYRFLMRSQSKGSDRATFVESEHLQALVQSYLAMNHFSQTLSLNELVVARSRGTAPHNGFRDPEATAGQSSSSSLAFFHSSNIVDTHLLVADEVHRINLLFDDDTPWRSLNLQRKDIPLVPLDGSSQATGGAVELLIEKLVLEERDPPSLDGKPEFRYTNIFLWMSSHFVCPEVLLTHFFKLFKTILAQRGIVGEVRAEDVAIRVLVLLRAYVVTNSIDFTRTALERLVSFCVTVQMTSAKTSADIAAASSALQTTVKEVLRRGTAVRLGSLRNAKQGALAAPTAAPKLSPNAHLRTILDIDDAELCRQLCLLSFSLFERVHIRELHHNAWTEAGTLKMLTTNLQRLVEFSRQFQLWVSSLVVTPTTVDGRRTYYRKLIRLCRALYNAQNFEMVSAILEGLRHPAVIRLKKTVEGLDALEHEEFEGLTKVMDPFENALRELPYTIPSPSIPIVSSLLGVFYRAEDMGKTVVVSDTSGEQLVNWSKIIQLAKPTFRWMGFQALPYPFFVLPNVQLLLWQMPGLLPEERLMEVSRAREETK